MKKYSIFVLATLVMATILAAGCMSYSNPSPSPTSSAVTSTSYQNTITIKDFAFTPSTLTIEKGANVTWVNDDTVAHRINSDTQLFTSNDLNKGDTFTYQFNDTGTFPYHCGIHLYMKGTIIVTSEA